MILNILGTDYTLEFRQDVHDRYLRDRDGYCDDSTKEIVVDVMEPEGGGQPEKRNLKEQQKKTIRHEIVHAFLHESGLDTASWAHNEEIVDWIALQFPKMLIAMNTAEAL